MQDLELLRVVRRIKEAGGKTMIWDLCPGVRRLMDGLGLYARETAWAEAKKGTQHGKAR